MVISHNIQVFGYEVLELTHAGANTNIYRATKVDGNTPTILKVLLDSYFSLEAVVRFKHEYSISASLDHPNIVKVISLETHHKRLVIAFEDFGGISLKQYLYTHQPSLRLTLQVAIAISRALAYIHDNKIIHKDIKPGNIIIKNLENELQQAPEVAPSLIVKLTDFSIASRLEKETPQLINPNQLEGTLAYMSPEQTGRMNRNLDYRSDFYSLGITLYEMLTGQLPFNSSEPLELVHAHIAKEPTPIQQLAANVPNALVGIVHKLMAKNAEDRYYSAQGLLVDLEQCLEQLNHTGAIADFTPGRLDVFSQLIIPQKLYGREAQVEQLLLSFARVHRGNSELILVSGYSGIGKTSVINEVNKPITQVKGYFISGKFDQFKRDIPYLSLVQAFSSLMRQLLTESTERLEMWHSNILQAVGSEGKVIIDVIPEVELIIGKQPEVSQLSPHESQNRFNQIFQKFIQVFCCCGHPLVLFLDDLQWADSATLNLIESLICDQKIKYLLIIGAYRNNEVNQLHPLISTIEEIKKSGIIVNNIELQPLDIANVVNLVQDTLHDSTNRCHSLATFIFNKTAGNPFFINQLIKALHQESLLLFDFYTQQWQWEIDEIVTVDFSDKSIVELVSSRIQLLPQETQRILQLAACIGDKFNLEVLSLVNEKSVFDTANALDDALQASLILPLNETYRIPLLFDLQDNIEFDSKQIIYKFLHDRVQQAAYSLIPEGQKQETHIRIGRLLLKNTQENDIENHVFDIVNQFNKSINIIIDDSEKNKLLELNFLAGRKSQQATAYEPALSYFMMAIKLTSDSSWLTNYETVLNLYQEATEAAYLCGQFDTMQYLANIVIDNAHNLQEKIKVYNLKILTAIAQKKLQQALSIGLNLLNQLGINFPEELTDDFVNQVLLETNALIPRNNIQSLLHLPEMTDVKSLAAMEILDTISTAAYSASPKLMLLINLSRVKLSLLYGNSSSSSIAYAAYALILCGVINDSELGYELGKVALDLTADFSPFIKGKILFYVSNFIFHWKIHLRETLHFSKMGAKYSFEGGDLEYTAWFYQFGCCSLYWQGEELSNLKQKIEDANCAIRQTKQEQPLSHQYMLYQVVLNLMDNSQNVCDLMGKHYNEQEFLKQYEVVNDYLGIYYFHLYKTILNYLFAQYEQASIHAGIAFQNISAATAQFVVPVFYFYDSLTKLAIYMNEAESEQQHILKQVQDNQEKMQKWAEFAPMNFSHKFYLVEAEICNIQGKNYQAMDYYDRAITLAQEQGYIQEMAIANELAAIFYSKLGRTKLAKNYMDEAHYNYISWGAIAKAKDLEQRYSDLLTRTGKQTPSHITLTRGSTTSTKNLSLDISTVVKASQALSSEIVLEKLLEKLMCLAKENAGAQKVFFIAKKDDKLVIEGSLIEGEVITTLQAIPITNSQILPASIINYVTRTQSPLVLDDVNRVADFNKDPYVINYQPKSILVSPIISQGKLTGILYLENNLTSHAFTEDRLEVLQILSAQAAISLENTRLYLTLEARVQERTQELEDKNNQLQTILTELQRTQAQLIHNEKMSSLGQLVAGVAHEINNPINFIYANVTHIKDYGKFLLEIIDFYQEEYPDSQERILEITDEYDIDFIKNDMPKLLVSMKNGAERIRNIVISLRNFSRLDESTIKEVDIHEGINNTLMILQQRLSDIEIIKEYGDLPKITCDAGQINQVFLHLFTNSIDAISERKNNYKLHHDKEVIFNPTICISTIVDDTKQVVICITDNGIGIDSNIISKIFDPFFTTKPVGKGTGLGLSISYQIIEKHHGSLECHPSLTGGTTFTIKLPIFLKKGI